MAVSYPSFYYELLAQERRLAERLRHKDNAGGQANSIHTQETKGLGQFRLAEPIRFHVSFLQEPAFTQGAAVLRAPDPTRYSDPVGTAGLRSWLRDDKGHYIGAYMYYRVDIYTTRGPQAFKVQDEVSMVHYLNFTGTAYKALDNHVLAQLHQVQARMTQKMQ